MSTTEDAQELAQWRALFGSIPELLARLENQETVVSRLRTRVLDAETTLAAHQVASGHQVARDEITAMTRDIAVDPDTQRELTAALCRHLGVHAQGPTPVV
jgi:hypothetical protein